MIQIMEGGGGVWGVWNDTNKGGEGEAVDGGEER